MRSIWESVGVALEGFVKWCLYGGFLLPTLATLVVGSGGPNAKLHARILGLSGGSVPFRGMGGD
jgi:hypothetical protein